MSTTEPTHLDPFAPGDSPQHPANFGSARPAFPDLAETLEEEYRRLLEEYGTDEERAAVEIDQEGPTLDDLREREAEYARLFDALVSDDDRARFQATGETPTLAELRERAEWARLVELYGPEHAELLVKFGTAKERADGAELVPSQELLQRSEHRAGTGTAVLDIGDTTPAGPVRPAKSADRNTWVAYAKELDNGLTDDDLKAFTVAGIQEMTAALEAADAASKA